MSSFIIADIFPGLVVHLDPAILRALGGSLTNAELIANKDRAVVDPHYFLVLEVGLHDVLATPLFSKFAPGSRRLEDKLKGGLADKWQGEASYFSRWQHWRIPQSSIVAASNDDESEAGDRRTYAVAALPVLADIAMWTKKNRALWRQP